MSPKSRNSSLTVDQVPLPAFLQQSKGDIQTAFVDLEWQQRNRIAAGLQPSGTPSQWSRLQGNDVLARNRYLNVEPWADNRVRLRVAEGMNDYINASPILLDKRRYISTQGPKDTSTAHFWSMIAHETSNPAVIVMLTQTHEAGREKCFAYFPLDDESSPLEFQPEPETEDVFEGDVTLDSSTEDERSRCTIRHMTLRFRNGGKESEYTTKSVYHLLFSGWPDFAVPEGDDRRALTQLVLLSRELNKDAVAPTSTVFDHKFAQPNKTPTFGDEANPRVVHCSAGVGRSGTFIALDYLLHLLETGKLDDVPPSKDPIVETVDKLRQQRMMMVQGDTQFAFLYEALRELWVERWLEKRRSH